MTSSVCTRLHHIRQVSAVCWQFALTIVTVQVVQWYHSCVGDDHFCCLCMQDRDTARRKTGHGPKCHFFNSFFVNRIYKCAHAKRPTWKVCCYLPCPHPCQPCASPLMHTDLIAWP